MRSAKGFGGTWMGDAKAKLGLGGIWGEQC